MVVEMIAILKRVPLRVDRLCIVLALLFVAETTASAQRMNGLTVKVAEEDEDADDPDEPVVRGAVVREAALNPEVFDQWLYPRGNGKSTLEDLESQLTMRITEIDLLCQLSLPQLQKLRLAGRTDIKRLQNRIDTARRQFDEKRHDQKNAGQLHQMLQPLRMELSSGMFGDQSLFAKVVPTTLTPAQLPRYEQSVVERQQFFHRAQIQRLLSLMEDGMPLRETQRQRLLALLEPLPPVKAGQYELQVLWLTAAQIPAEKYRDVLDGPQWTVLQAKFTQQRNMEPMLRQMGLLPKPEKE